MTQHITTEIKRLEARLERLEKIHAPRLPTVMVYGAYNHGKSSLLNALIGEDVFSVSDRRETRQAQSHEANGVCWLDTPGLFADTAGGDDRVAQGELDMADHLLLVHNLGSGELDQQEEQGFQHQVGDTPERCTLILTALDGTDDATRESISAKIAQQLPGVQQLAVSSHRYAKGMEQNKQGLIRHSCVPRLKEHIASQLEDAKEQRTARQQQDVERMNGRLETLISQCQDEKRKIQKQRISRENSFLKELFALQQKYQ